MISSANITELFTYDKGKLFWKIQPCRQIKIGTEVGTLWSTKPNRNYRKVIYKGKGYFVHRLIWIFHYGDIPSNLVIDHIDGDKSNNAISNLRTVTQQQNCHNRVGNYGVTSYFTNPGKSLRQKFRATIIANNVRYHLGVYNTQLEAEEAYNEAKSAYHIM